MDELKLPKFHDENTANNGGHGHSYVGGMGGHYHTTIGHDDAKSIGTRLRVHSALLWSGTPATHPYHNGGLGHSPVVRSKFHSGPGKCTMTHAWAPLLCSQGLECRLGLLKGLPIPSPSTSHTQGRGRALPSNQASLNRERRPCKGLPLPSH